MPDFAEQRGILVPRKMKRSLSSEIATPRNDFNYPLYGNHRVVPRDWTLRTKSTQFGESSYAIYDDVLRDPHAYAVMQKRYMEVVGRNWVIHPGSERRKDKKAAEMIERHLIALSMKAKGDHKMAVAPGMGFNSSMLGMMSAILKGFSVGEIIWGKDDKEVFPKEIRVKDQRRFAFTYEDALNAFMLRLLTQHASWEGVELPPKKFIIHTFHGEYDSPLGYGLGEKLYWPVFFKKNGIRFWLMFADKFGSPTAIGKFPDGLHPAEEERLKKTMLEAINKIAQETGVVIPENTAIEFLEAQRSSTTNTYESMAQYMDAEMSKTVLGETGSTDQSGEGGSRARDEVGNSVRISIAKFDADLLAETLNRTLIRWDCDFNFPAGSIEYPTIEWQFPELEEKEDLNARVGRDKGLLELGVRLTPEKIEQVYGDGYIPATGDEDQEQPPLVATLGVGGTTSLMQFLQQGAADMPRDNAIAVLTNVFGISEESANEMIPEQEEVEEAPEAQDELANIFGGGDRSGLNEEDETTDVTGVEGDRLIDKSVELAEGDRPKDIATLYSEQAAKAVQSSIDRWTEQINAIVQEINDGDGNDVQKFAELEERLYSLYSEIEDAEYAEILGQAIASAELAGRYEVMEDIPSDEIDFSEFVDFVEALEFISAKAKQRNCNPQKSFPCGRSCQTLKKNKDGSARKCRKPLSGQAKNAQEWLKMQGEKQGLGNATSQPSSPSPSSSIVPERHSDYEPPPPRSLTDSESEVFNEYFEDNYGGDFSDSEFNEIYERMQDKHGISEMEAKALAMWTSEEYVRMAKGFYDPDDLGDDLELFESANRLASGALHKIPPMTSEQVAADHKSHSGDDLTYDASSLRRSMSVSDPAAFAKKYQDALDSGGEIQENSYFATTYLPQSEFDEFSGNVEIKIKAKADGTGQGRYVDDAKPPGMVEGEILYPPYSRFKVAKVTETGSEPSEALQAYESQYDAKQIKESLLSVEMFLPGGDAPDETLAKAIKASIPLLPAFDIPPEVLENMTPSLYRELKQLREPRRWEIELEEI